MTTRFGYVTVASSVAAESAVGPIVSGYESALESMGGEKWQSTDVADPAPLLVLVATGGSERAIMDVWRRRAESASDAPVLLVAHPGNNSLPSSLEALARLRQDGSRGRIVTLSAPSDEKGLSAVAEAVRDVGTRRALRAAKIGLVGSPSAWLVASSPDPSVVRSTWGPHVVNVDLARLVEAAREGAGSDPGGLGASLSGAATDVVEPSAADLESAGRLSSALGELVERNGFAAVALRCFDLIDDLGTTGCVALAELADRGVIAACEGDLTSAVAMLWVRELLGAVSWMANPASIDADEGVVLLAHCCVPRSMVDDYKLRSHFESGKGVALQGTFPREPVTLVRAGGKSMECLWVAEGDITATPCEENLCRTQVEVTLTGGDTASDLLTRPLGNHIVMLAGSHAGRLRSWWEMMIAV